MACSSCGTKSGGGCSPKGCKNNGTCGTGGCNKLNVYDWLRDMELPDDYIPFNIVEVRFKGSRKEFYRNPEFLELYAGDYVVVEGAQGLAPVACHDKFLGGVGIEFTETDVLRSVNA